MSFSKFIKDKLLQISLILFSVLTVEIFFIAYPLSPFIRIYVPVIVFISYFAGILFEFYKKKRYYTELEGTLERLDEKYLISEIIKKADFSEGKILNDIIEQINKSMHENVNKYKYLQEDYKEYIELWIHEIKLPIATSKMIIENNKTPVTKSIAEELDKVENYTEQALFYARSNTVEKDYFIKECSLKEIVNESVKKNKTVLIQLRAEINAHNLESSVYSDGKWIVFILNQLIQNSIKYKKSDLPLQLEFFSEENADNTVLYFKDNGLGIKKSEISKVFDKGFTGTNGRLSGKKSTGIGLYLCKKLSDKLGISLNIFSKEGNGTEIKIIFPKSSFLNFN